MNSLSWLIYLAEVSSQVSNFITFLAFVCGFIFIATGIATVIFLDETDEYRRPLDDKRLEWVKQTRSKLKSACITSITFVFIFGLTASLLPSRQTVLLIAASEIGERVVLNERVQSVVDPSIELLQTWIQQQTQELRRTNTGR